MSVYEHDRPGPVLARAQAEHEHARPQAGLFDAPPPPPAAPDPVDQPAPLWQDAPFEWCLWYLRENGHIYRAFRDAADALFERHPTARTSAETIIQHLRYLTPATADGDPFKVNNNARSLFARLYIHERPHRKAQFERRRSHLDDLGPTEKWALVRAARDGGST